ncbi:envelope glycoprotein [Simian immunodeficiency virus]|uniref:Envelope glycoprotein gp160 n=1 Tax=Simian immunodeficiency virus agm.grivet (isolate AGM gr-1) TaxID=31684 RepID=ENV_SIVG1|nr:envelope protein [Simian immunodeficiency virus]Q02837.1 RecName: Full=Envelope glycoprotein gp160; AltName: Full=Env polyprotein; Contains: RecName: Full=Surface protein gp120; Short=SU; AltName: Full=Glycoprotein 120; Short=gp120; Contains: RecName: Full=Transmembrane protein gp41; Short=TM; AltName: Full=Glycoprotein 32; Short=gp32; Flags: Precursor [Simian immunodeficiency virus (isolate AGM / clone GRI-1)]AAA47591.1 envelope protein [Simian immunodeficiency virus]AAA91928.1 envelope glyc
MGRLLIKILIIAIGISIGIGNLYVTVFYGIPVWKNSTVQAFCMTPNTNMWATTNCIPDDHDNTEVPLNITEAFEAWDNPLVKQAESNIHLLFEQTMRPCVKLSPICIKMSCVELNGTATTKATTTATTTMTTPCQNCSTEQIEGEMAEEPASNCTFAIAGYQRDVKKNYSMTWYDQELVCNNKTGSEKGSKDCYMIHCNDSVIKEACDKTYWDTLRVRYCAPAGYALLKCNDKDYRGFAPKCKNVSVVHCTRLINTTITTGIGLNGSRSENRTEIWQKGGNDNDTVIIKLNKFYNLTVRCRRPGNKTVLPVTIMAGLVFHSQKYNTRLKQAWCHFQGDWKGAWKEVREEVKKVKNLTEVSIENIHLRRIWGDPESANFWFNCQGEFFYCKMDWFINYLNNRTEDAEGTNRTCDKGKPGPGPCVQRTYVACHIRQVVNDWYTVSKKVYAPPREGHLECNSSVTALYVAIDYNNKSGPINVTLSPQVRSIWAYELGDYKLVEITPIGFAPTDVRRYTGPTREKRVPFVLGFLGFLGAAGTAMGAAATTLTVQSRHLLAGILQQQKNLLAAVEQQQQLLKLTIWGVKNLNARVTALEKYLEDQARLNSWGCAWKQVCHTTVPWKYNNTPKWDNMTWLEWERQINALEGNITQLLEEAQNQESKNLDLYQKLDDWSGFWSWFSLSTWLGYVKIGFLVIVIILGLRFAWVLWGCIRNIRQGYNPLPQIHIHSSAERPDNGGGQDRGGESSSSKLIRLQEESSTPSRINNWWLNFKSCSLRIRTWCYNICLTLLIFIRTAVGYLQYGLQQLQEAATGLAQALARAAREAWGRLGAIVRSAYRAVINSPRRVRQGLEKVLG